MSAADQFPNRSFGKTGFEIHDTPGGHDLAGRLGGARVINPRRVTRFLEAHAKIDQVHQDLNMPLRLHVPADHPKLSHGLPSRVTNAGMIV